MTMKQINAVYGLSVTARSNERAGNIGREKRKLTSIDFLVSFNLIELKVFKCIGSF